MRKEIEPIIREDIIEGRNAVLEAIVSGRPIDKLFILKGAREGSMSKLIHEAKQKGVVIAEAERGKLDSLSIEGRHQGVVAVCACKEYVSLDDILEIGKTKGEPHFIVVLDEIEDPHNLGAILRSCDGAGVHGVIIPKRRSVGLNGIVAKTAAGAAEHVPVCKVSNIADTIIKLKEKGIWVYGADGDGEQTIFQTDFRGNIAVVIGSEGFGISPLVKKRCDALVRIPSFGRINSLNASVAAGIILFEVVRQNMESDHQ